MTDSLQLLGIAAAGLKGNTAAGNSVYAPGDWPTYAGEYPYLRLQIPREDAESLGHATPIFETTATLRITGRVQAPAKANDAGAADAEAALGSLRAQILANVINYPPLMILLQRFAFFRSQIEVTADGAQHIGTLIIDIGLEFIQGPEDFYPQDGPDLTEVTVTVVEPAGTLRPGLTITLPTP